jgi:PE family
MMSLLSIAPDIVAGASDNLAGLGSALRSATAAAANQTTSIAAPAADEVSAAITALFGTHAQGFQAASAKAAAFHDDFVNLLKGGAAQYVGTEAASTTNFSGNFGPLSYSFSESATGANGNVSLSTPFHPALSFSATTTSSGANLNATGTIRTPLGPVTWLSANGSASATADGGFHASLGLHSPFTPSGALSVTGTPLSTDTQVGESLKATGSFHTPLGPVNFLSASGKAILADNGAFSASISAHTPGASEGLSLTGTVASGTPVITGGSISVDGFKFSF